MLWVRAWVEGTRVQQSLTRRIDDGLESHTNLVCHRASRRVTNCILVVLIITDEVWSVFGVRSSVYACQMTAGSG